MDISSDVEPRPMIGDNGYAKSSDAEYLKILVSNGRAVCSLPQSGFCLNRLESVRLYADFTDMALVISDSFTSQCRVTFSGGMHCHRRNGSLHYRADARLMLLSTLHPV